MSIQTNLARGLKERFLNEYGEELFSDLKEFANRDFKAINRNNFEEKMPLIVEKSKGSIIKSIIGGERRSKYLAIETLSNKIEIQKNEWNEDVLHGMFIIMKVGVDRVKVNSLNYLMSGHAILRIFERTKKLDKDFKYSKFDIINEVNQVSLWTSFWNTYAMINTNPELWESLSYIIPSTNGIFLCKFNTTEMHLDVRTFVDESLLNDAQNIARKKLYSIGKIFNETPLTFGLAMVNFEPNVYSGLLHIMTKHVTTMSDFDLLLNQMTKDIIDDKNRSIRKKQMEALLKDSAKIITDDFYKIIQPLHINEVLEIIRKGSIKRN